MDKPVKDILKKDSRSNVVKDRTPSEKDNQTKSQTWNEMNIIATYKPEGKEYGHMSIDEAETPYRYNEDDEAGSSSGPSFAVEELRARLGALTTVKRGQAENDEEGISLFDKELQDPIPKERRPPHKK